MLRAWQDRLLFQCVAPNPFTYPEYRAQELRLTNEGVDLQGWHLEFPQAPSDWTLLYFGGNAEDITQNFERIHHLGIGSAYFFNYRGYGDSQGKPSQQALYADAVAIADFLLHRQQVPAQRLLVLGRSLGTAMATYVAAQRSVGKLILTTPFDSIRALAQQMFPWLPVSMLLHHPFPSIDFAPQIQTPALFFIAEQDEVIPLENSMRLYRAWGGSKELCVMPNSGHNDLHVRKEYEQAIRQFLGVQTSR